MFHFVVYLFSHKHKFVSLWKMLHVVGWCMVALILCRCFNDDGSDVGLYPPLCTCREGYEILLNESYTLPARNHLHDTFIHLPHPPTWRLNYNYIDAMTQNLWIMCMCSFIERATEPEEWNTKKGGKIFNLKQASKYNASTVETLFAYIFPACVINLLYLWGNPKRV